MRGDARFWRNVSVVTAAHGIVIIGLARWTSGKQNVSPQNIVWMDASVVSSDNVIARGAASAPPVAAAPTAEEENSAADDEEPPTLAPVRSDLQIESPTPTPRMTPAPTPPVKPTPKATPKTMTKTAARATPKSSPKPRVKSSLEKKDADDQAKTKRPENKESSEGAASANGNNTGAGSAKRGSQFGWYGAMLHDRLHKEWEQPTSVVASGAKMSALVKLRIERDGRVSQFEIIKPSGNVVVDESVAAVAKKVTQVDPLPKGLGGEFYEVKINFELNPEE